MWFDVKWRRPGDPEVLECHGLSAEQLVFRIRGVIRMCGGVELVSVTLVKGEERMENEAEYSRRARWHMDQGNRNAEQSHEWAGEVGAHYSALAEAHHGLAAVFSKLAGEMLPEEREP